MSTKEDFDKNPLPEEWIELVKEAMKSSITKEEFREFLEEKKREMK